MANLQSLKEGGRVWIEGHEMIVRDLALEIFEDGSDRAIFTGEVADPESSIKGTTYDGGHYGGNRLAYDYPTLESGKIPVKIDRRTKYLAVKGFGSDRYYLRANITPGYGWFADFELATQWDSAKEVENFIQLFGVDGATIYSAYDIKIRKDDNYRMVCSNGMIDDHNLYDPEPVPGEEDQEFIKLSERYDYFWKVAKRVSHCELLGFEFNIDSMAGTLFWDNGETQIYATPFWEDCSGVPVSIMDGMGDEILDTAFALNLIGEPGRDWAAYKNGIERIIRDLDN